MPIPKSQKWLYFALLFIFGSALVLAFLVKMQHSENRLQKTINTPAMNYKPPIILETQANSKNAVIWLHGLGADGNDFVSIVQELKLDQVGIRFIFPNAPLRAVTINNGHKMPAWYDIKGTDIADKEDTAGITESHNYLDKLIEQTISSGIKAENIVLAGFSQGGAVATYTYIRSPHKLGGCMALSTYVPFMANSKVQQNSASLQSPIFWGHGNQDTIVPEALGKASSTHLEELGYNVEWHSYPMAHSVNMEEINDISNWLKSIFRQ